MDDALLQRLRESQDAELGLRNALDAASVGYWTWVRGEAMRWDGHMRHLFGIKREATPAGLDDFLQLLDEASQEAVIESFEAALNANQSFQLTIMAEKTALELQLSGRPYLLPRADAQALSGICMKMPEVGGKVAASPPEASVELANFASVASHDLREPLRMISSYLRLLEERSPDSLDARAQRYIRYACDGADRMRCLIEDLLSYARLDSEAEPPRPVALPAILTETINNLSPTIRETGADVAVALEQSPVVLGDRTSLVRLFQNLIGNAIKFHAEGQRPRVVVGIEDGKDSGAADDWIVSVTDHGIGIAPEHHELLFGVFQRLHTRDEYEGSGIGLASCRKIVERLGGRISVDSARGQGSTFRVQLKKARGDDCRPDL